MPLRSIVLDTNVFVTSAWPEPDARMQSLLRLSIELVARVFVPQAVFLELKGRLRRDFQQAQEPAQVALEAVRRQIGGDVLYTLNGIPGMWHEQCLANSD